MHRGLIQHLKQREMNGEEQQQTQPHALKHPPRVSGPSGARLTPRLAHRAPDPTDDPNVQQDERRHRGSNCHRLAVGKISHLRNSARLD